MYIVHMTVCTLYISLVNLRITWGAGATEVEGYTSQKIWVKALLWTKRYAWCNHNFDLKFVLF